MVAGQIERGFVRRDEPNAVVHVLTSDPERKTSGLAFAATKCWLNFVGRGFVLVDGPATCGTCTKV